ncbi:NUDIX domain-containing protein [Blastopirellula sp. JC732]|uniref:8-oxo-dGTP diphosphatase n=1 Tax=Blastopirellula sediminis TaxID=2894196 RepID=A0A9X1MLQ9_9BACT|nr:NUDIX domain-containing protein [Blastopirellula sediminis]MCC9609001.1 NUDIX domain-containing protein [Blastopirellula sediminis]MCC9628222.1 NUDIX domain-containing protein [Blastopirellula sediminis]
MSSPPYNPQTTPVRRKAAVAVIVRQQRLLVIRRSQKVAAPGKLCFPGGGILPDETEHDAVVREIAEEMGVMCFPQQKIWHSQTSWGTEVAWWSADIAADAQLQINEEEVAEFFWLHPTQLHAHADLLPSNHEFLTAWKLAKFTIAGFSDPFVPLADG